MYNIIHLLHTFKQMAFKFKVISQPKIVGKSVHMLILRENHSQCLLKAKADCALEQDQFYRMINASGGSNAEQVSATPTTKVN